MIQNDMFTRLLQLSLVAVTLLAIAFRLFWPVEFTTVFAREDGVVEYGTAILLFLTAIVAVLLGRRAGGYRLGLLWFYGFALFLAAGEEISWGQRIFGIASPEFFLENNYQQETNLHNLVVGEEQLVKFWFGTLLTLFALLYLVFLPWLYPVAGWVRKLMDLLAVPVPARYASVVALGWSLLVLWIDLPRNWEAYEYVFAALLCLAFSRPVNRETFQV
ncbi:MAG: hypothetical protein AAF754_14525 [Pseudomonadota bacterium]